MSGKQELQTVALSGQYRLKNDKDFPISLTVVSVKFRQGVARSSERPQTTKNIASQLIAWRWLTDETVALQRAFGAILDGQPIIIESKSEAILPLYLVFRLQWFPHEKYCFVELDIEATVEAVHPRTGQTIEKSTKKKHATFRGAVARDGGLTGLSPLRTGVRG